MGATERASGLDQWGAPDLFTVAPPFEESFCRSSIDDPSDIGRSIVRIGYGMSRPAASKSVQIISVGSLRARRNEFWTEESI